jgi:hypothetical protein
MKLRSHKGVEVSVTLTIPSWLTADQIEGILQDNIRTEAVIEPDRTGVIIYLELPDFISIEPWVFYPMTSREMAEAAIRSWGNYPEITVTDEGDNRVTIHLPPVYT